MSEASVALTVFEGCARSARQERLVGLLAVLLRRCSADGVHFHEALLAAEDRIDDERKLRGLPPLSVQAPTPGSPTTVETCRACGKQYRFWRKHLRWNPTCVQGSHVAT